MTFNDMQQRALWAAALREIADRISDGTANPPTTVHFWTQYVSPTELLRIADFSPGLPLKIRDAGTVSTVTVPTGERLQLPIDWSYQAHFSDNVDQAAIERNAYETHNEECVPVEYTPV